MSTGKSVSRCTTLIAEKNPWNIHQISHLLSPLPLSRQGPELGILDVFPLPKLASPTASPGDRITSVFLSVFCLGNTGLMHVLFSLSIFCLLKVFDTSCMMNSASFSLSLCWSLIVFLFLCSCFRWYFVGSEKEYIWLTCCL